MSDEGIRIRMNQFERWFLDRFSLKMHHSDVGISGSRLQTNVKYSMFITGSFSLWGKDQKMAEKI